MIGHLKKWLVRHVSFDVYLIIAKALEPIEQVSSLLRYIVYTKTKEGSCLKGTINPRIYRITSNAVCRSLPYVTLLAVAVFGPAVLQQSFFDAIAMQPDMSIVSGFMTAVLAIAGIFLTLFYTNAITAFSNRYPSCSGNISNLFVSLISSDKNLSYCATFVIVTSLSFVACAAQCFNWIAFLYIFILSLVLVWKLHEIFSLGASKTDITAVVLIPVKRFLALAKAASFDKAFSGAASLVIGFKRLSGDNLMLLDEIMDYGLTAGDYALAYSKSVNQVILETLAAYSEISVDIDVESIWHSESRGHKSWFMSSTGELNQAIFTGTIPQPEKKIDRLGYHRELYRISDKYGKYLVEDKNLAEYSRYFDACIEALERFIENGDIAWALEYSESLLSQCLRFCLSVESDDKERLQAKCHLLEQYAAMLLTVSLGLAKLCGGVATGAFHFDSFGSFSQEELQRQGFPLGDNEDMKALCAKLKYEKEVFGKAETPKWWFNKRVDSFGTEVIERLCFRVSSMYSRYCSDAEELVTLNPKSCYTLALKEAELFRKFTNCICKLRALAESFFAVPKMSRDYIADLNAAHVALVKKLPDLAKSFVSDEDKLKDFFPDLYGFAFFNYCQQLFEDIINSRLSSFCESIVPLYHLSIMSSMNLQGEVSKQSLNEVYKAQVLFEPIVFFLELCGMAYVMAELNEDYDSQEAIASCIKSLVDNDPREKIRWTGGVSLADDFALNGKVSMDLFNWRRRFLDAVAASGKYPDAPKFYPAAARWNPPADKERLLKMLPADTFDFCEFNGCKIFGTYLLGIDEHD